MALHMWYFGLQGMPSEHLASSEGNMSMPTYHQIYVLCKTSCLMATSLHSQPFEAITDTILLASRYYLSGNRIFWAKLKLECVILVLFLIFFLLFYHFTKMLPDCCHFVWNMTIFSHLANCLALDNQPPLCLFI